MGLKKQQNEKNRNRKIYTFYYFKNKKFGDYRIASKLHRKVLVWFSLVQITSGHNSVSHDLVIGRVSPGLRKQIFCLHL